MRIDRQNVQPPRSLAAGLAMSKRFGARFRRDEDGAIMLFSLFMFMMILFIGGSGVDLMRFETERAKLQSTLDRAVLAAADAGPRRSGGCGYRANPCAEGRGGRLFHQVGLSQLGR